MQPLPSYDSQFVTLFQFSEGCVRRHIGVDVTASDYNDLEIIAYEKAESGMQVDIMAELVANDPMRTIIFPDVNGNKNPDLRINGTLWEVEGSHNSKNINNLKHATGEASRQADCIIVNVSCKITKETMFRVVKGRFKDHINLKVAEFRYKAEYTMFYK